MPNSLESKVFKARYYSKSLFMEAELGAIPSYVWRSVIVAKEMITMGICKTVGSGANTKILGEPWLPDVDNPYMTSNHRTLTNNTVQSLMKTDILAWDGDIITDLFNERDAGLIRIGVLH